MWRLKAVDMSLFSVVLLSVSCIISCHGTTQTRQPKKFQCTINWILTINFLPDFLLHGKNSRSSDSSSIVAWCVFSELRQLSSVTSTSKLYFVLSWFPCVSSLQMKWQRYACACAFACVPLRVLAWYWLCMCSYMLTFQFPINRFQPHH